MSRQPHRACMLFLTLLLAALLPSPVHAATGTSPIAPFVDESTAFVAQIDLSNLDLAATEKYALGLMQTMNVPQDTIDQASLGLRAVMPKAQQWVGEFTKAGGKSAYLVVSITAQPMWFIVLPLDAGADGKALTELLKDPFHFSQVTGKPLDGAGGLQTEVIGKALVMSVPELMPRVKQIEPAAQPDLDKGLDAAGAAPVRASFILTSGLRAAMVFGMPKLPPELGGGSTQPLQGIQWANLAIDSPPKTGARLTIQSNGAETAGKLRAIADAAVKSMKADKGFPNGQAMDQVIDALTPQVTGDQLKVSVDDAKIQQLAKALGPVAATAREHAAYVASASNIRQILLATIQYSQDHKDALPKDPVKELKAYLGESTDQIWTNPVHPDRHPGYVYLHPAEQLSAIRNPELVVMVHDAFDAWPAGGVNVGFADGHVERLEREQAFRDLLASKGAAK